MNSILSNKITVTSSGNDPKIKSSRYGCDTFIGTIGAEFS
jgi:hypothetical protein